MLGERSKPPDHSALITEFRTSHILVDKSEPESDSGFDRKCYKLKSIPRDFMTSDTSKRALQNIISKIESARETQTETDNIYTGLCDAIISEMDRCIPLFDTSNKT